MATTQQLMAQYGVAWFDFDEASGNIHDKLGLNNYVGTVTGATRVGGWNGEGNAITSSAMGHRVLFSSTIIPTGDFTIKLKMLMQVNTENSHPLCTLASFTTGQTGLNMYIRPTGEFGIAYYAYNASQLPLETSGYTDGKWHDILVAKDASFFSLYIDGKLIVKKVNSIGNFQHSSTLQLLSPTMYISTANRFLKGNVDDLQIYNKALSPSDFEQKRLVVKTTDNKNLVLSPTSARVKEIPNTAEYMMLAQGGVVREIDSAVDRPPIDFTKPTTEYELVTNNRTPLGKGGMFTIPIGTDFKTAMIEDNY
ncbi:LamG-like jellyroll fold domain-containing protein [Lysinibacillus sp. FSL M8-0216]|uniref:LamG-like jellyroll fold domain-containing protein n=1 Tax=Lysinibacillus sp. FSL M8-0216 TaxID=2921619 RepID=UPI00315A8EA8